MPYPSSRLVICWTLLAPIVVVAAAPQTLLVCHAAAAVPSLTSIKRSSAIDPKPIIPYRVTKEAEALIPALHNTTRRTTQQRTPRQRHGIRIGSSRFPYDRLMPRKEAKRVWVTPEFGANG